MSQPDEASTTPMPPDVPGGGRFANAVAKRILYHTGALHTLEKERDELAKRCKKLVLALDFKGHDEDDFQECSYCGIVYVHDEDTGWCCNKLVGEMYEAHKFWCKKCDGETDGMTDQAAQCQQCWEATCSECEVQCLVCPITPHCANCDKCKAK